MYLSTLVIGEVRRGIELSRRRGDSQQAERLYSWLRAVLQRFPERIRPVDVDVADTWGHLAAIRPVPVVDALLAATAKTYDMILVTRNISDVQGLGVELLNPFEAV